MDRFRRSANYLFLCTFLCLFAPPFPRPFPPFPLPWSGIFSPLLLISISPLHLLNLNSLFCFGPLAIATTPLQRNGGKKWKCFDQWERGRNVSTNKSAGRGETTNRRNLGVCGSFQLSGIRYTCPS